MQQLNNLLRGATFFQHAGVSIVYVFMPILAQSLTSNIFEVGLTIASFFLAQILSSLYFGRISDARGVRLTFIRIGFIGCAAMFGLHYVADNSILPSFGSAWGWDYQRYDGARNACLYV